VKQILQRVPFDATLNQYQSQAEQLLAAYKSGDADAVRCFHHNHPRFLDPKIPWLPKELPDSEILNAGLGIDDAQLTLARWYDFRDWAALAEFVAAVTRENSDVARFETAVEAVVNGDEAALRALLEKHPELVRARSTRITKFDPAVHGATLLHYIGANGVENYRQKTPPNEPAIAKILLDAGAYVTAMAGFYGADCATMGLLVSSCHPAQAGLQAALAEILLDYGAPIEGPNGKGGPLNTALRFGYLETAQALVRRGAKVNHVAAAAGLGRVDDVRRLLPESDATGRQAALALSAQLGQVEAVRLLLDAGEDPNRLNPEGIHSHSTPLHQAALAGHEGVVRLLVERGARLDIEDTIYHGTPLGWAMHGGQAAIAEYLRSRQELSRA